MSALDHTRRYVLKPSKLENDYTDKKPAGDSSGCCGNCCGKNTTKHSR